ncbi:MAG: hypothetical protein DRJ40_08490, partial [Thermoprotei archaeon]
MCTYNDIRLDDITALFIDYLTDKTYLFYKKDSITIDVRALPRLVIDVVLKDGVHAVCWIIPKSNGASLVISVDDVVYRFDFFDVWSLNMDIARVVCPRIVKIDVNGRKLTIAGDNVIVIPLSKIAGYLFT